MKFVIISCSPAPIGRSYLIAREVARLLTSRGHAATFIDLRAVNLPPFDNADSLSHPDYARVHRAILESDGIFLATPVYNWSVGSAAKNLIELTGATNKNGLGVAWFDKIVTFLCAGGLPHSYMAYGSTALSLMLDFKCVINPYAVYATDRDFSDDHTFSDTLTARIDKTVQVKIELAKGLSGRRYRSKWEV
ncbi:NAD(P)H-dependent oxidoreductase [Devosia algicola]|uniref:NAD(P)H-dependent oxidoreductase n=1 Tax=Devosia algicola TaxID=3026418 RepID=A0ABY7YJF4_9HYPH|nr:NADPH-dependent FMN reductase [Devosia algicola]WDR01424.1 NAD(P)H-dependent oxidoreductase [Devosia algicola]